MAITSPAGNGTTVSSSSLSVSGTAFDSVGVTAVYLRVNGGTWVAASGTTSWAGNVSLSVGINTIDAYSKDAANNASSVVSRTVTYTLPTPLQAWRQTYFGSIDNSGDRADLNDFDKDGIPNIVEFAFGLNPQQNSAGMLPQAKKIGSNLMISFAQSAGVSGITYGAEWSQTLLPGSWTLVPDTGTSPQHTFSVPIGTKRNLYMRLKVTSP